MTAEQNGAGVDGAGVRSWTEVRRTLPKARLVALRRSHARRWFFASFRLANAWNVYCGPLLLIVRAPWLERSARALYPARFSTLSKATPQGGEDER
jgi:hypothetical protein